MSRDAGRVSLRNVTLFGIMTQAYGLKEHQILAPKWFKTERYTIEAKCSETAGSQDVQLMLQDLLRQRFQLAVHSSHKEFRGFALVVAEGGPKVDPGTGSEPVVRLQPGHFVFRNVTSRMLADVLSSAVQTPVVDKTDISLPFNMNLNWELNTDGSSVATGEAGAESARNLPAIKMSSSIFAALREQRGLILTRKRIMLETLVVDHAIKQPKTD